MKYAAYPKYNPSGVEWLGDVPELWHIRKLGHISSRVGSGKTPRGGAETYVPDGVMLIRSQNIYSDELHLAETVFIDEAVDAEMAATRVKPRDLLLNITGASLGRSTIAPKSLPRANVNQHVCIIRIVASKAVPDFVQRIISSATVQAQIFSSQSGSSREGLNFQQVRRLIFALPPLKEQCRIADFLDDSMKKLDTLVAKKQALVEKLNEKRIALLSRTITRGLPPEAARAVGFNPHPRLKSSGVEWLGRIPEHWELIRLRHLIRRLDQGWSPNACAWPAGDGERGVLKLSAARHGMFVPSDNKALDDTPDDKANVVTPEAEDLLISRSNTPDRVGDVCHVLRDHSNLLVPDLLYRVKLDAEKAMPVYVCLFLLSRPGRAQIEKDARGSSGSMVKLGQGHVRSWLMPVPPLEEQRAISRFLNKKTAKIDQMISKVESAIELLKEYRSALINAAVTGKIDVREASQRLGDTSKQAPRQR